MPNSHQHALKHYYDANTRRFLLWGGSGQSVAIHRGLWDDGITDAEAAARRIHDHLVAQWRALQKPPPQQVLDLGCGVGGTLLQLAKVWPEAHLTGITLSPQQAQIAQQLAAERGVHERYEIIQGDFFETPLPLADCVIAIESHVHAPTLTDFMTLAARQLKPGGVLLLVDDFLRHPEAQLSDAEQRLIENFRRGWRLGFLATLTEARAAAQVAGLTPLACVDYSQHIKLDRTRDQLLRWVAPALAAVGAERWPLCANMIGGNALTQAYRRQLMQYALLVLGR